jgi:hypothetical protein
MEILQGPSSVVVSLFLDQIDCLGTPLVRFDIGTPQVVESPQNVVVPAGREGEEGPVRIHHFTRNMRR